jgi:glycosyltransferase involved in cell wall biosynthesis
VAFCGPIGAAGKPAGGGYEAANRRTCDALARRGLSVIELPYPKTVSGALQKLLRYAWCFAKAGAYLLAQRERYDVLHLTPLNAHFALAETLLASCARLMGKPVLVDIRAGTFMRHYQGAGLLYRSTIDRTLRLASRVAVEGQEYMMFARHRSSHPVFYFPNYVDNPALRAAPGPRRLERGETVRLLYFGRLVPEKGISTALQALALLVEAGQRVQLEFIGEGPAAFLTPLQQTYAHLPVTWSASQPVHEVMRLAANAHFFFFASRHDGEGHSNALNEAMAVGLVPVCSAQGFARSVVGNAGIVLAPDAKAADYAAAIESVLAKGCWAELSARAHERVRSLYSEEAAVPPLIETYRLMLQRS